MSRSPPLPSSTFFFHLFLHQSFTRSPLRLLHLSFTFALRYFAASRYAPFAPSSLSHHQQQTTCLHGPSFYCARESFQLLFPATRDYKPWLYFTLYLWKESPHERCHFYEKERGRYRLCSNFWQVCFSTPKPVRWRSLRLRWKTCIRKDFFWTMLIQLLRISNDFFLSHSPRIGLGHPVFLIIFYV